MRAAGVERKGWETSAARAINSWVPELQRTRQGQQSGPAGGCERGQRVFLMTDKTVTRDQWT